ncbi:MAG: M48 family metalloprotease [Candidatus Hydrogenedentes bacterium]|nr:M48 family metalloprotease [Candidatus Hydrogenedentota bacterium]
MNVEIGSRTLAASVLKMVMAVLCLATVSCATLPPVKINLLSTQDEIELGDKLSAEIEKQETVLDDAAVQAYVRGIGDRLAALSPRQDVAYKFTVIDAPDKVNAFALPGGHMYVYTGLMLLCESEAELAGVMAHEIGHVAGHHHGESMTRQYGMNLIASILLGNDPGAVSKLAAQLATTAGAMYYSRENEREADATGMNLMVRAGYNPEGMVGFMKKLLDEERKHGGGPPLALFASHPPTAERVQRLTSLMAEYPQANHDPAALFADRYRREAPRPLLKHKGS